jgi:WD40 repeat protein
MGWLIGHEAPIHSLDLTPSGRFAATADERGSVRVFRISNRRRRCVAELTLPAARARGLTFAGDANRLLIACDDATYRVYSLRRRRFVQCFDHGGLRLRGISASADGRRVVGTAEGNAHVFDGNGRLLYRTPNPCPLAAALLSADGTKLATTSHRVSELELRLFLRFDRPPRKRASVVVHEGSKLRELELSGEDVRALSLARDGSRIAALARDLSVIDLDARGNERSVSAPDANAVALSGDGRILGVGMRTGFVELRDLDSGGRALRLFGHAGGVNAVALSARGHVLVSAGQDGCAAVLRLAWRSPERAQLAAEPR